MMTQEEMNRLFPEKLKQIEEEYGVKALYAAETGSRVFLAELDRMERA